MLHDLAENDRSIDRKERKLLEPELRRRLLAAQNSLSDASFAVLLLFGGVDGAGKGETANQLGVWMDPRRIRTKAFGTPSDEERERPPYWRYWRAMPPRGSIGIFLSAWYTEPLLRRVYEETDHERFDQELERIRSLERMLAADGTLLLKFWMHLGKAQQKVRFEELEADPLQRWRVTDLDWKHWRLYDRFVPAAEHLIQSTDTDEAPWIVVEGTDANYRELTVGIALLDHLEERLRAQGLAPDADDADEADDADDESNEGESDAPQAG